MSDLPVRHRAFSAVAIAVLAVVSLWAQPAPQSPVFRSAAKQFIERSLQPGDPMIVRVSGGGPAMAHQFTARLPVSVR